MKKAEKIIMKALKDNDQAPSHTIMSKWPPQVIADALREAGLLIEEISGVALIAKERREQIEKHGRTVEHDIEKNGSGQIMRAARALIMAHRSDVIRHMYMPTDWDAASCMSMGAKPYKERLIIAGALIAAEIDRLQNIDQ